MNHMADQYLLKHLHKTEAKAYFFFLLRSTDQLFFKLAIEYVWNKQTKYGCEISVVMVWCKIHGIDPNGICPSCKASLLTFFFSPSSRLHHLIIFSFKFLISQIIFPRRSVISREIRVEDLWTYYEQLQLNLLILLPFRREQEKSSHNRFWSQNSGFQSQLVSMYDAMRATYQSIKIRWIQIMG